MSSNNRDAAQLPSPGSATEERNNCNNRSQKSKAKWQKGRQNKSGFVGKTREMNGQVFQLQAEQKKKGQFQETLDQLKIYSSSVHIKDIKHLKILCTELELPVIVKPELQEDSTPSEQAIFVENVK